MWEVVVKIWYIAVVLPFLIFLDESKKFSDFLKKKNIYAHWDVWHSYLFISIILLVVLWANGYR